MGRFRCLFSTALFAVGLAATPLFAAAPLTFKSVRLGTLGGKTSASTAANDIGQLAGYSLTATGAAHAFLYSRGKMNDLGTLGGANCFAADLNNAGHVVGWSQTAAGSFHAFRWDESTGKMTDLNPAGATVSAALAVNDRGKVAGAALVPGSALPHAFLWRPGQPPLDLGTGLALDINDSTQVVGLGRRANLTAYAFLWENGRTQDLGTLGGANSYATGINNRGQVVGQSQTASGEAHAFVWSRNRKLDLNPPGSPRSYPLSINDAGQVVGLSVTVPAGTSVTIAQSSVAEPMIIWGVLDPHDGPLSADLLGSVPVQMLNVTSHTIPGLGTVYPFDHSNSLCVGGQHNGEAYHLEP
jgi:probable HAF family extracellular repeat protein